MKRKYVLFLLPLLVPILAFAFAHLQARASVAPSNSESDVLVTLWSDIERHPFQSKFTVYSYESQLDRYKALFWSRRVPHLETVYDRSRGTIETNQSVFYAGGVLYNVSDQKIHNVARKGGGWHDLYIQNVSFFCCIR
jgi:hypothetical protein